MAGFYAVRAAATDSAGSAHVGDHEDLEQLHLTRRSTITPLK